MMLCLAESLTLRRGMDTQDQMERYVLWRTQGYMSSSVDRGAFDIGRTTATAIGEYVYAKRTAGDTFRPARVVGPSGPFNAGNGGIMRLAPVPILFWRSDEAARTASRIASAVTHASAECLDAAAMMATVIVRALNGEDKQRVTDLRFMAEKVCSERLKGVCHGDYKSKSRDEISTSGYVVDTLEAALWSFHLADSFMEGLVRLLPMGKDVDTVCCVYGQIAGAFWGFSAIPQWLVDGLQRKDLIARVAEGLVHTALTV